jgi:prophage DNA circulation protein
MRIRDIHNPWRDAYQEASFRGAPFFVETEARSGGRRAVPHLYPKRNDPYTEDMGRAPVAFVVQAYLIGRNYLRAKDQLITALEDDGPGALRMPMPYQGQDLEVMVMNYTITESREKGGMCTCEMEFIEYGKPGFTGVATNAAANLASAAMTAQEVAANFMQQTFTPSAGFGSTT